ncbi:MAG: putative peptidoglycan glycosyltransferase FtsW [Anaerolineales bacterium]
MTQRVITQDAFQESPLRKRFGIGFDPWLFVLVAALIAFGLVMVYSSSWDVSWRLEGDPYAIFEQQVRNLAVGLIAMVIASFIPMKWIRKYALPLIAATVLMLFLVLLVNLGAEHKRAFLGGSVQPSEMAKLALIIYLAVWMESKGERLSLTGYGLAPLIMIVGLVGGLILLQPDLSAGFTVVIVAVVMFYLAGADMRQILAMGVGGGALAFVLVRVSQVGQDRWNKYVGGLVDLEKASYHVQQSLQSFYSGGIFGRGLGASRGKFGFLPAPHTDSIFAIVGEELGLIGAIVVLVLFCLFLWRGFRLGLNAVTKLEMLLVSGVTFWIGIEAVINMSVLLGLLPFAGNALPFFSFGGSSLVTTLAGVGLLINVSRRASRREEERDNVATIGIGGRDRRRRVSRIGRSRRTRKAS